MQHRHIAPQNLSSAAIDDIIERGSLQDWYELSAAARSDRDALDRIERIARARAADPSDQRFHFWLRYAARCRAAS